MKLSDRIRRWWAPAKWRDEHPEISDGEGFSLSADERLEDIVARPGGTPSWAANGSSADSDRHP